MSNSSPKLVIFDCDGVLVDSEPISITTLARHVRASGRELSDEGAYDHFLGRSMATIRKSLENDFGMEINEEVNQRIRNSIIDRLRVEVKAIAGIEDVLRNLQTPFCVASSSQPDRIRLSLGLTGLLDYFEPRIFSAAMVAHGKPAPDLFLYTAKQMGVAVEDCIVIEDSPAGIRAAQAAGMRVFAFHGGSHAGPGRLQEAYAQLKPDLVFDDMRELLGLLGQAEVESVN